MAEYAFLLGPKRLRRYSKIARMVVITTIVGTQVGACCVYYVFIATNVEKVSRLVIAPYTPHISSTRTCSLNLNLSFSLVSCSLCVYTKFRHFQLLSYTVMSLCLSV